MENLLNTKDFKGVRNIILSLGPACNMQCKHCHQTPDKELMTVVTKEPSEEVLQLIDNYIQYSQQEEFIKQAESKKVLFTLQFYGGEPLLYWPVIQKIVERFMAKYDLLSNTSFRFSIVSNGLCLSQAIVDFVNKYDMLFALSYDAPHPFAVRGFISNEICALANKIKRLKIICSGCAYNCDPMLARQCLMVKFPEAKHVIRTEVLRTFPEMDKGIDTYDLDVLRTSVKKIFIAAKMGDDFAFEYAYKLLYPMFHPEKIHFRVTEGIGSCVSGFREMTVTLDGKIPFCYNSFHLLGSLTEDTLDSVLEKGSAIWKEAYDPECKECEGRDLCYWGCMLALRDDKKHMYACEGYRKPFFRIIKEEMVRLTTPLTEEEKNWYKEQERIMDAQVTAFLRESSGVK